MSDALDRPPSLTYSVVVPTKDRRERALATVSAVLSQTRLPERVVVVDASTKRLVAPVRLLRTADAAGVDLVVMREEPSTSAQRNAGIRLVTTPVVLFLDDDMILPDDYADVLLRRWEAAGLERFGGIVGTGIVYPTGTPLTQALRRAFMLHYFDPNAERTIIRRSGKLRYARPTGEVVVPAAGAGAIAYRTDLVRKHPFDEHFPGYALGEDLDMSVRLSADAPIMETPAVACMHALDDGERTSRLRWYYRGRRETYFRLRMIDRSPLTLAAFALSVTAETTAAALDSLRERDLAHLRGFVGGFLQTLRETHEERLKPRPYYVASRALQRVQIARGRHRHLESPWEGVRIFGYHRVIDADDVLAVPPERFRRQMEAVLASGARPIRLDAALDLLRQPVQGRYFCVTFDDGYYDNAEHAVPILQELGIPATIFVPTAVVEGRASYSWYRRPPRSLTWSEIDELVADGLVDAQAHGQTHQHLPKLDDHAVRAEMIGSKRDLEEHVPYRVTSFCYPAGLYGEREMRLLRESGFRAGVTTDPGVNAGAEPYEALRRTMIYWGDTVGDFEAKLAGLLDQPSALRAAIRRRRVRA